MTLTRRRTFLLCLLLIAAVGVALPHIGQLPMTHHAKRSHAKEMVNADKMVTWLKQDLCKDRRVYRCPAENTWKILCKVTSNVYGGIIIGNRGIEPVIITAYGAAESYWIDNTSNCYQTVNLPFALP